MERRTNNIGKQLGFDGLSIACGRARPPDKRQAKIHFHRTFCCTSRRVVRREEREKMTKMMSACGVICSECPAYFAASKGLGHQQRVAEAWQRIYALNEIAANITCSGCLGPDEAVFYTCRRCNARNCCRTKGFNSCAECPEKQCKDLEKAQSNWDEVPQIGLSLSSADFDTYARPYCDHRERLAAARADASSTHGSD